MKTINFYICVMVLLFTIAGHGQFDEGGGGSIPGNYYGPNPTPPGYASPFTFTGTNHLTGVTITTSGPNWGAINARADAEAAARAGAIAINLPNQPPTLPPPYPVPNSQPTPPPPSMDWFLDNDGDGWHSQTTKANTSPGLKWITTTRGVDCDDTNALKNVNCTSVTNWYLDNDGDDYHLTTTITNVSPGTGWKQGISKGIDCDDTNSNITVCILAQKDCDTEAAKRGADATKLLNSVGLQDVLKRLRDKTNLAKNKKESGLSIEKQADGTIIPFNEQNGETQNVIVKTSEAGKILVGGIHTHIEGMEDGPSPQDIYHLIGGYQANNDFSTDFNIAENGNEYALVVENSANLTSFAEKFPQSSNIDSITNNFLDTNISGSQSLKKTYDGLLSVFYNEGFSVEDVHEMALASMLDYLKTGLKILKKEKGTADFKELSVEYIKDASGKLTGIKIKKCN